MSVKYQVSSSDGMENKLKHIMEELYIANSKIDRVLNELYINFKNLDVKKIKRNRTERNRCCFVNVKRKKPCSGYVCKKSSTLCYAHHVRAMKPRNHSSFAQPVEEYSADGCFPKTYENPEFTDEEIVELLSGKQNI